MIGAYITREQFRMHGPSILFEGKGYGLSLAAAIASDGNTVTSYEPRLPAPPLWDSIDQWGEKSLCDSQLCAFISVHIDFLEDLIQMLDVRFFR